MDTSATERNTAGATPTGTLARASQVIDLLEHKESTTGQPKGSQLASPGLEALSQRTQASSLAGENERQESYFASPGHEALSQRAQASSLAGDDDRHKSHLVAPGPGTMSEKTQLPSLAGGYDTSRNRHGSLPGASSRMERVLRWGNPQGDQDRGESEIVEAILNERLETWFIQQAEAAREERRKEYDELGVIMDALP